MADGRAQTGAEGEAVAACHLQALGLTILARNWQARPLGELDLVAVRGDLIVFVEVRTVRTRFLASPVLTVDARKMAKVARAADRFLRQHSGDWARVRFDVVGVNLRPGRAPRVEHIEDAFTPEWGF